jgi:hypothetical protein
MKILDFELEAMAGKDFKLFLFKENKGFNICMKGTKGYLWNTPFMLLHRKTISYSFL